MLLLLLLCIIFILSRYIVDRMMRQRRHCTRLNIFIHMPSKLFVARAARKSAVCVCVCVHICSHHTYKVDHR
jgi:hypothetical protein